MPILGIIASSTLVAAGDFESIATVSVGGGGAANVEFTSIPATYTHLQIRYLIRGANSSNAVETSITYNNSTTNYRGGKQLYGDGSTAIANGESFTDRNYLMYSPAATATASVFSAGITDILDYANTNKYKVIRSLGGFDSNVLGNGFILFRSGLWMDTSAITSIKITAATGNLAQYSHFALYGIKGA